VITCRGENCDRLVLNATPIFRTAARDFDIREFCSATCQWSLQTEDDDAIALDKSEVGVLITCIICAMDKPRKEFIERIYGDPYHARTTIPVPHHCQDHVAVQHLPCGSEGVCIDCIRRHIHIQFRDRGPAGITCIIPHVGQNEEWEGDLRWRAGEWYPYAYDFLPKKLHKEYTRRSIKAWWNRAAKWECPAGCNTPGTILDPDATRGYPHVECSECRERFCGVCRVPWHKDLSCQQYREEHPEVLTDSEKKLLTEMAALGARYCPRCHWITIKDGGCSSMNCRRCLQPYTWFDAEIVRAPISAAQVECVEGMDLSSEDRAEEDTAAFRQHKTTNDGQIGTGEHALEDQDQQGIRREDDPGWNNDLWDLVEQGNDDWGDPHIDDVVDLWPIEMQRIPCELDDDALMNSPWF
jgi:hypothetical protein